MLAARKTHNLRGSFRPRLPWTEKRSERFRNYRPERSTFQCSRTATANRSTHIIPHGSGKRRDRGNLWNQENLAAKNEYRLKDFQTLHKTRRDLPEIGRFSSRRDGLRSLCWSLSFCAETKPQVNRMRHKTHALSLLARLFNLMKTADYLAGWGHFLCTRMGLDQASSSAAPSHPAKFSLRALNLTPIHVRGFARRAFRLFAPTEFLQGFFELRERTEGGICARPEKF